VTKRTKQKREKGSAAKRMLDEMERVVTRRGEKREGRERYMTKRATSDAKEFNDQPV